MRIAPRTMLCGTGWRVHSNVADRFDELRELCTAAGDKASLAIGMTGLVAEHFINGRVREASQAGSELMALVESIGDPTLTLGLASTLATTKFATGEMAEVLRWSQIIIDLAHGDPTKGNLVIGSPLAIALATRGNARYALGDPGWRDDLDRAAAMARENRPVVACACRPVHLRCRNQSLGSCSPTMLRCVSSTKRCQSPSARVTIWRWAACGRRWESC